MYSPLTRHSRAMFKHYTHTDASTFTDYLPHPSSKLPFIVFCFSPVSLRHQDVIASLTGTTIIKEPNSCKHLPIVAFRAHRCSLVTLIVLIVLPSCPLTPLELADSPLTPPPPRRWAWGIYATALWGLLVLYWLAPLEGQALRCSSRI